MFKQLATKLRSVFSTQTPKLYAEFLVARSRDQLRGELLEDGVSEALLGFLTGSDDSLEPMWGDFVESLSKIWQSSKDVRQVVTFDGVPVSCTPRPDLIGCTPSTFFSLTSDVIRDIRIYRYKTMLYVSDVSNSAIYTIA